MNFVCCPNCGGPLEAVSIGWKCRGKCKGFVDMGGVFYAHKEEPFLPIMTNADRIRSMSDDELASILVKYEGTEKRPTPYGGHEHIFHGPNGEKCGTRLYAVQLWKDWLRKPVEED